MSKTQVDVDDNKYTFQVENGIISILRYGKEWITNLECQGSKAIISLIFECEVYRLRLSEAGLTESRIPKEYYDNIEKENKMTIPLQFKNKNFGYSEAILGNFYVGDGVRFTKHYHPTCYRRGEYRLTIEIALEQHHKWGCFDDDDQPLRYYHNEDCLIQEADSIALVLLNDRFKHGDISIEEYK